MMTSMTRATLGAWLVAWLPMAACGDSSESQDTGSPDADTGSPDADTGSPDTETPRAGGTLVASLAGDIARTDSALIDDINSGYVAVQAMEGLVGLAPGTTGDIIPVLAAELPTVSADGLTYLFTLRSGVAFHDGTALDCEAVAFNYERWLNLPEDYAAQGYTYYIDVALKAVVASVACRSPRVFTITLRAPSSAFLLTQTLVVFSIASPAALIAGDASSPDFARNTYAQGGPTAMTGTGPFKLASWIPGDSVTLERNAAYWDAEHAAALDGIVFRVMPDSAATLAALQASEIHFAPTLAPSDGAEAARDAELQVVDRGGSCNLLHLAMNQGHPPFDDPKIRRAVAFAVDKQALIDTFYEGQAVVADNWMPPGTASSKPLNLPTYDPDRARALIAESGVTDLTFDFWYPSDVTRPYMPDPKGEFESILEDLEAVGFHPQAKTAPWRPDYLADESVGSYPMWLIGWNCDWAGPDNFLNTAFFGYRERSDGSFGPNEEYAYESAAMWQAMQSAMTASDPAEATRYWQEVQDILAADMPTVPLLSAKVPGAARRNMKGLVPSATLTEVLNGVWLEPWTVSMFS